MKGLDSCPCWLNKVYRRSVCYVCQLCNKPEKEVGKLTPHRITRGHMGGKYTLYKLNDRRSNVKIVCNSCHKLLHGREFNKK